jgi:erythromycin esterase
MRAACILWAIAMANALTLLSGRAYAQLEGNEFVKWASTRAIPLTSVEPGGDLTDMLPLKAVVGSARVVAIGEPTHGAHEPLAFRNRLTRFLVEQMGFTAVAVEGGFTESWSIHAFVTGGGCELAAIVRNGFTYGFGEYVENQELIDWIRRYNSDQAHTHKVHFYGIDLTGGQNEPFKDARRSVDFPLAFLAHADSAAADRLRREIEPSLDKFDDAKYGSLSSVGRERLESSLVNVVAELKQKRSALVAASSAEEYDWALHSIEVARQLNKFFQSLPVIGLRMSPEVGPAMMARDSAMAENVRWVLGREGADCRLVLFAHNAHIMNSKLEGGFWAGIREKPSMMGTFLRAALGRDLVIIGGSAGGTADDMPRPEPIPTSVDSVLATTGIPRFLLDLRPARDDPPVLAWLSAPRPLHLNITAHMMVTPVAAFDAFYFVDKLTPAHTAKP